MRMEGLSYIDEHCLICGAPAINESGHFHRGNRTIIAGWCEEHLKYNHPDWQLPTKKCTLHGEGCFGDDGELNILVEDDLIIRGEKKEQEERKDKLRKMGYK